LLKDKKQRERATDPTQSFIVQAPAGSGKTELLTQRFLRLLNQVEAPEQIVALTFTKKAASEMRERILVALQSANDKINPTSDHQRLTQSYATLALQRDEKKGWELLKHPRRLRVMTIDSLCQSLVHAIPFQEKQIPFARVTEQPQSLYRKAARDCLQHTIFNESLHSDVSLLLEHLDNNQEKILDLFCTLLTTREQWQTQLYTASSQSKAVFEQALKKIEHYEFKRFINAIPDDLKESLCNLSRQVVIIENNPNHLRHALFQWNSFEDLSIALAKSLANLLLTQKEELRKTFDHHIGLRADVCDTTTYQNIKQKSKILLQQLQEYPGFLNLLIRMKNLPSPEYENQQWKILQALFNILPLLLAHLELTFKEANQVDFNAISQQAVLALGTEDEPTDLALYLDHGIHHLLIDEFQDTSLLQFQLLSKLVQGWLPDEGKTLFVVGDPMQSIYRFRQAEVGLFLKAKEQGIASISLIPLELCCNFRSSKLLVEWVNTQFSTIFPKKDDMESGAICFHASSPVESVSMSHDSFAGLSAGSRKDVENSAIHAYQYVNKTQEAEALSYFIEQEQKVNPNVQIAILVRSRSQLKEIVPILKEKNISYQGVEIEQLSILPHLKDVLSLTKALLMPAHRLAWLSLLRSPYCGLSLEDLHSIANWKKEKTIFEALSNLQNIEDLSLDGKERAAYLYEVLNHALERRHQHPLIDWIRLTLDHLQKDKILKPEDHKDLEQFWLLLEQYQEGTMINIQLLESKLQELYSQQVTPSNLQIMTIHKSKGLEFDCVILPSLGRKPRKADKPLLQWLQLPARFQDDILLVSPIRAVHEHSCLLYDYLSELDLEKDHYEQQRLLYVALTRAKTTLYLLDNQEDKSEGSFKHMLNQTFISQESHIQIADREKTPLLFRLDQKHYKTAPIFAQHHSGSLTISPPTHHRFLGIVAHELLQWICNYHPTSLEEMPWDLIKNRFIQQGFSLAKQQQALDSLKLLIHSFLKDPIGLWIAKYHSEEQNEYALLVEEDGEICTRIIDRTFCEKGIRWIIDFKTGTDEITAQEKHRSQVHGYALHFSAFDTRPVRCGLYYLATGKWMDWAFCPDPSHLKFPSPA
jgi:ATP-dependent exoDNAse (exonuclease V) beta subunit